MIDTDKTCGKHANIPPPLMSKHKTPRVLARSPGQCKAVAVFPMCSFGESHRVIVQATDDATKCPCWEAKS